MQISNIQVAMYSTIIVWNYASMCVSKCVFWQAFKYAAIYLIKYVCFQAWESIPHCKYVSVQVCKYKIMQLYKYESEQNLHIC